MWKPVKLHKEKNKYNIVGINCEKDHNSFVLNLLNLYEHKEHEYHFISGNSFYIFGSQGEIEKYLLSFKGNFIARKFQTPRDFEKNYQYYFDINNKYSNNFQFTVFEDNIYKRSNLVSKIIIIGNLVSITIFSVHLEEENLLLW